MSAGPMYIIVLDQASNETRTAVHEVIKENANGWWHHLADVWVAGGLDSPAAWRDLLKPLVKNPTSVTVFRLPDSGGRNWAYFGTDAEKRTSWLHNTYK